MFARIGTWQGSPADLERWIVRGREQVKPAIRQDPGLTAVYWLVDREAGKGMIVTLWESREAMAIWRSFPATLRVPPPSISRATCIVSVEPPETIRPPARTNCPAARMSACAGAAMRSAQF